MDYITVPAMCHEPPDACQACGESQNCAPIPMGFVHETWRDLTGDTLYVKVRTQTFEDVSDEVKIFIKPWTVEG